MIRTAYVTLWYPKPSETFVVGEVAALRGLGMPVTVYTLYGKLCRHICAEMERKCSPVVRLGTRSVFHDVADALWWWRTTKSRRTCAPALSISSWRRSAPWR